MARGAQGRYFDVTRSESLRIAMISYYLPSESKIGVGYQVHELANELARRGHQVDVFQPMRAGPRCALRARAPADDR